MFYWLAYKAEALHGMNKYNRLSQLFSSCLITSCSQARCSIHMNPVCSFAHQSAVSLLLYYFPGSRCWRLFERWCIVHMQFLACSVWEMKCLAQATSSPWITPKQGAISSAKYGHAEGAKREASGKQQATLDNSESHFQASHVNMQHTCHHWRDVPLCWSNCPTSPSPGMPADCSVCQSQLSVPFCIQIPRFYLNSFTRLASDPFLDTLGLLSTGNLPGFQHSSTRATPKHRQEDPLLALVVPV